LLLRSSLKLKKIIERRRDKVRKRVILIICIISLLPVAAIAAKEKTDYSLSDVVKGVIGQSLDAQSVIIDEDISLSPAAYRYQESFSGLKEIAKEAQYFAKKSTLLGVEYEAYQLVYGYYKEAQSVKLQADNLKIIEKEYQNLQEKYKEGLIAKGDLLRANMSLKEAELSEKATKLKLEEMTLQVNQRLRKELNSELTIHSLPKFSKLNPSEYDPKLVLKDLKEKHLSLVLIRKKLQEYKLILGQIDSLPILDEANYVTQISGLEQKIKDLTKRIDEANAETKEEELSSWISEKAEAEIALKVVREESNKSREDQKKAKSELKDYYEKEIKKAEIELLKQEQRIEIKVYQFANQFEILSERIKLIEEKIEQGHYFYDQQKELFDVGEIIFTDLQKSQQQILADQIELTNVQLDYQLIKEELRLFKNGYML